MGFRVILTLHPKVSLGWRTDWKVLERWAKREPLWGEASSNLILLKKKMGTWIFHFFDLTIIFYLFLENLLPKFKVPSHRSHHIKKKKLMFEGKSSFWSWLIYSSTNTSVVWEERKRGYIFAARKIESLHDVYL